MKKYIISILMLGVLLFALCGCGGSPLAKAYDSLSALTEEEQTGGAWNAQFDEENDVLSISINNGAEVGPIFEALNEEIEGQDIGTLLINLSGTKGDDWDKELDQQLGKLSCNSIERLGLNYPILDYKTHKWTALGDKTEKLYLDTNCNVFWDYGDKELKALSSIKDVDLNNMEKAIPAFCTIVFMPFTYSIANGIALGLITHCVILLLTGKVRQIKPLTVIVSLIFVARYAFITLG